MEKYVKLIDLFLNKKIEYSQFYSVFNNYYAKDNLSNISQNEFDLIEEINERLLFAAKNPSIVERKKHKYIDEDQLRDWLDKLKEKNISFWPEGVNAERQTKHQAKLLNGVKNRRGGIFFEVGGNMVNDGTILTDGGATVDVAVAGNYTSNKGKIIHGKKIERWWEKPLIQIIFIIASLLGIIGFFLS